MEKLFQLIARIVSGGQTGVDRGALDAAVDLKVPCGGWCPKGRRAEDGMIPEIYPLKETTSTDYHHRTEMNVIESDGTLIVAVGSLSGGTALTKRLAEQQGKPVLVLDIETRDQVERVVQWVCRRRILVLNVAGPRESQRPGIQTQTRALVKGVIETFRDNRG